MKKNLFAIIGVIILVIIIFFVVKSSRNNEEEVAVITPDTETPVLTDTSAPKNTYTAPVPLVGTQFKLVAVNNKLAPAGDYTISFTDTNLSAKFCNGVGGAYTMKDYVISAPALMGTLMFCEQPAGLMAIEQLFSKMMVTGVNTTITGDVLEFKSGTDSMIWQVK